MPNKFNDTAAKKGYLVTFVLIVIGLFLVVTSDTSNVHGEGVITMLGGMFLIGLSIFGLVLFLVFRLFSK